MGPCLGEGAIVDRQRTNDDLPKRPRAKPQLQRTTDFPNVLSASQAPLRFRNLLGYAFRLPPGALRPSPLAPAGRSR